MDPRPVETTLLSFSSAPPARPDERREDERYLTLFRVGSIQIGDRRELCLIKNVSAGGMRVRAYSTLGQGTEVEIELKSGQPVRGSVSWFEDRDAGIAFHEPIDVVELLSASDGGPRPRMPRIEVDASVMLREGANLWRVHARDVSQGGVKLRCSTGIANGSSVVITLPGLAPVAGVVSWSEGDHLGVSFNKPLPLEELVKWLRDRQACTRKAS